MHRDASSMSRSHTSLSSSAFGISPAELFQPHLSSSSDRSSSSSDPFSPPSIMLTPFEEIDPDNDDDDDDELEHDRQHDNDHDDDESSSSNGHQQALSLPPRKKRGRTGSTISTSAEEFQTSAPVARKPTLTTYYEDFDTIGTWRCTFIVVVDLSVLVAEG